MEDTNLSPEMGITHPHHEEPKKSKKGLIIAAVVALFAVVGGYVFFNEPQAMTPPTLSADSQFQGYLQGGSFNFAGKDDSWSSAHEAIKKDRDTKIKEKIVSTSKEKLKDRHGKEVDETAFTEDYHKTKLIAGVNIISSNTATTAKEVIEAIDLSEGTQVVIAGYSGGKFQLTPPNKMYKGAIVQSYDNPEDIKFVAGEGIIVITFGETKNADGTFTADKAKGATFIYGDFTDGTTRNSSTTTPPNYCDLPADDWSLITLKGTADSVIKDSFTGCESRVEGGFVFIQTNPGDFTGGLTNKENKPKNSIVWVYLAEKAATGTTAPSAPTGFTATEGNESVTLKWTQPTDTEKVTQYQIYHKEKSVKDFTKMEDLLAVSNINWSTGYTLNPLTNGTAYVFKIAAINETGKEGAATAEKEATPKTNAVAEDPATAKEKLETAITAAKKLKDTTNNAIIGDDLTPAITAAEEAKVDGTVITAAKEELEKAITAAKTTLDTAITAAEEAANATGATVSTLTAAKTALEDAIKTANEAITAAITKANTAITAAGKVAEAKTALADAIASAATTATTLDPAAKTTLDTAIATAEAAAKDTDATVYTLTAAKTALADAIDVAAKATNNTAEAKALAEAIAAAQALLDATDAASTTAAVNALNKAKEAYSFLDAAAKGTTAGKAADTVINATQLYIVDAVANTKITQEGLATAKATLTTAIDAAKKVLNPPTN